MKKFGMERLGSLDEIKSIEIVSHEKHISWINFIKQVFQHDLLQILSLCILQLNNYSYLTTISIGMYELGVKNLFYNIIVYQVFGFITNILLAIYCKRMRRKLFIFLSLLICILVSVVYHIFWFLDLRKQELFLQIETYLAGIVHVSVIWLFAMQDLLVSELFHSQKRTVVFGFIQLVARVFSVHCGYMIVLADKLNINPLFYMGYLSLISLPFLRNLPETYNIGVHV